MPAEIVTLEDQDGRRFRVVALDERDEPPFCSRCGRYGHVDDSDCPMLRVANGDGSDG